MDIVIKTLDGEIYNTTVTEYDAQQIAELVNTPDKFMVAIGDVVVNGRNIKSVVKAGTQEVIV